jgi:hypothetical protein
VTALSKYTDIRSWLRHLARSSVHAGTGAVLAGLGSNAAENIAPILLEGLGMDWRQMASAFIAAAALEALRRIHTATADTTPPIP